MNGARRLSALCLLVVCAPLVHADETSSPAKPPAATSPSTTASKPVAAKPAKPAAAHEADDELLEFLGSVDEESDREWIDYLSKTDISKAAKAKATPK